jgi:ketosteroid isomerase-like protein
MELFAALLRSSMGDQLAPGAVSFTDMLADDAVMEFPYAPSGLPKVLNGKVAIRKHVEALGGMIRVEQFSSPVVHQTPSGFVIEFSCSGIATQTDALTTRSMSQSLLCGTVLLSVTAITGIH